MQLSTQVPPVRARSSGLGHKWTWLRDVIAPFSLGTLGPNRPWLQPVSLPHSLSLEPSSPSSPSPMTSEVKEVHLTRNTFCRYRSVVDMVKSWHQEKQHYSFPHPRECNPRCPSKCSGSVCSHYTQVSTTAPPAPQPSGTRLQTGGQLTAPWAAATPSAANSSSRRSSSSWDPGSNPGSCLLQIGQQGWQQAACLPEGCKQLLGMPSHPGPPRESGCSHGGPRSSQPTGVQLGPSGHLA